MAANSALWSVVVFALTQQLQQSGFSPTRAGLALLPASAGILLAGTLLVPRLRRRLGSVRVAGGGLVLGSLCVGVLAVVPARPDFVTHLLVPLVLLGTALSATATGLMEHTLKGVDTVSAAILESSVHVGGAVAVASYAAVIASTGEIRSAYVVAVAPGSRRRARGALVTSSPRPRWTSSACRGLD